MNTAELYHLMENPGSLSEETLPVLKEIVDDFPFFHAARMLYLKNLAVVEDVRFGHELKRIAVSIPDRKKLFLLIEGERYHLITETIQKEEEAIDTSFALIDHFLTKAEEPKKQEPVKFEPSLTTDYMYWMLSKESQKAEPKETPALQHQDLIDSFISNDSRRKHRAMPDPDKKEELSPVPASVKALNEDYVKLLDESYFTETLARIYIKQHRYEKAIEIFKKLSLKYPEKSVYFADQIGNLEKLIINTKK